MTNLLRVGLLSLFLASPVFAIAQTSTDQQNAAANQPKTRQQVKDELRRIENAGYNPASADPRYPRDIQAAEKRANAPVKAQPKRKAP